MTTKDDSEPGEYTGELTQREWQSSTDAAGLIGHLAVTGKLRTVEGDRAGERKMRLFGTACCQRIQHWNDMPLISAALIVAEKFADGEMDADELYQQQKTVEDIGYPNDRANGVDPTFNTPALQLARAVSLITRFDDGWTYYNHIWEMLHEMGVRNPETQAERRNAKATADLFRDIFGNPFRPVAFSPDWRTDTAVSLARQTYKSRDFSAMPILADALQDAGCDSADILAHCRGDGPHVRGCWVLDLVLGKE